MRKPAPAVTARGYFQETLEPIDNLTADMTFRFDKIRIKVDSDEFIRFDFGTSQYVPGDGKLKVNDAFDLLTGRFGLSYNLNDAFSTYFNFGYGEQVPSTGELEDNIELGGPGLDAATAKNYEVGLKGRGRHFDLDLAFFYTLTDDEIVQVRPNIGDTFFQNAGKTEKLGVELSSELEPLPDLIPGFRLGANYAYSDFSFDEFSEVVGFGGGAQTVDRSGNQFPKVPRHYYTLSASYYHPTGFHGSIRTRSWGKYFIDNANSEKYEGFDFVTDVTLGYRYGAHSLQFNVYNVFDQQYAAEVRKSTGGDVTFRAAAPLTAMATYQYNFEL